MCIIIQALKFKIKKLPFHLHNLIFVARQCIISPLLNRCKFLAKKQQVCVIQHPRYLPDLSLCDYFLFLKIKMSMKGMLYDDVEVAMMKLKAIPKTDLHKSIYVLVQRCIDAERISIFRINIFIFGKISNSFVLFKKFGFFSDTPCIILIYKLLYRTHL